MGLENSRVTYSRLLKRTALASSTQTLIGLRAPPSFYELLTIPPHRFTFFPVNWRIPLPLPFFVINTRINIRKRIITPNIYMQFYLENIYYIYCIKK